MSELISSESNKITKIPEIAVKRLTFLKSLCILLHLYGGVNLLAAFCGFSYFFFRDDCEVV